MLIGPACGCAPGIWPSPAADSTQWSRAQTYPASDTGASYNQRTSAGEVPTAPAGGPAALGQSMAPPTVRAGRKPPRAKPAGTGMKRPAISISEGPPAIRLKPCRGSRPSRPCKIIASGEASDQHDREPKRRDRSRRPRRAWRRMPPLPFARSRTRLPRRRPCRRTATAPPRSTAG